MSRHRHCLECGLDFEPRTAWDKHCSDQCIKDGEMQKPKPGVLRRLPDGQVEASPPGSKENPILMVPPTGQNNAGWICPSCQKLIPFNTPHGHAYFTTDSNTGTPTGVGPFWPWGT